MNLYPETNMGFLPNQSPSSPRANVQSPVGPLRPRLPPHVGDEILRSSTSEMLSTGAAGTSSSPLRQKLSLPAFLPSPSRLLQQLPASPASLLLSPLRRKDNNEQLSPKLPSSLLDNGGNSGANIEQIDQYFLRRRQYLQHNIEVSLNMSRWLLENVVFYSIETLRRQAQIQGDSSRAYLTPLSAIRMIYTMKYQQGSGVLWKGCFSSLILTTAESLSNNLIDEIAPFTDSSSILKHLTLKTISSFLLIPIYSVHLLRSVQSDLTFISNWSPLNIFIEPFQRMLGIKASSYARALPLWQLISLSLPYFVGRHVIQYFLNRRLIQQVQNSSDRNVPRTVSTIDPLETIDDIECQLVDTIPSLVNRSFIHVEASIISVFLSQFILYPYETVLNRLFVQGTRTIVDNLDKTGIGCVPINTRYLGFFDCCRTISEVEGGWARGFYKGIGFLILKFGLIYASAHCLKVLAERLAIIYTQNTSEMSKFHHYIASNQQQQHETESN